MITINKLSYVHPDGDTVFNDLDLAITKYHKVALVGKNGSGKSTLLKIVAGDLLAYSGTVHREAQPYYIRQHFGQLNALTVAQALGVEKVLGALEQIANGHITESNMALVGDDWLIEQRCYDALKTWGLHDVRLDRKLQSLSGGEKTKVLLSGIIVHEPELILLDEPGNHMDKSGRELLYQFIASTKKTLLIASHDRTMLNLLDETLELADGKIKVYGGNYDFYAAQKALEREAHTHELQSVEKDLRKAREIQRETMERKQRLDARGKKKQEKAGVPKIVLNTLRNKAEKSTSKLKGVHAEKIGALKQDLFNLREKLPAISEMKFKVDGSKLHHGKKLFEASAVNIHFSDRPLWQIPLTFTIYSGERILITGHNGSGKTTLVRLLMGDLVPQTGVLRRAQAELVYVDQEYSLIYPNLTVIEQAQRFNTSALPDHEVRIRLNRFLFDKDTWDKPCASLSGGEKMRLMLCCMTISNHAPDVIVLDEPTNNLDIENVDILSSAIKSYEGTVLLISHETEFARAVGIGREISLVD